jgi:hypothetical protein
MLVAAKPRVLAAHVTHRPQVAVRRQASAGIGEAAVSVLEGCSLSCDEGVEVVRGDELVLRAVDELDEVVVRPVAVVDEVEVRAQVADEEELPDAVEHVRVRRHVRLRRALAQHSMTEAVEVRDRQAGLCCRANSLFNPLLELARCLHVVGQDEDLLGEEVFLGLEEPPDALDDDAGLARAGTCDDHDRSVGMLDDAPLLIGQREGISFRGEGGHRYSE